MDSDKIKQELCHYGAGNGLISSGNPYKAQLYISIFVSFIAFTLIASVVYFTKSFGTSFMGGVWMSIIVVGVLTFYYDTYTKRKEWLFFGEVVLKMSPFPGKIGNEITGEISVLKNYTGKRFNLELACKYYYEKRVYNDDDLDKEYVNQVDVIWSSGRSIVKQKSIDKGVILPFSYIVPDGLPDSDLQSKTKNYHLWELELTTKEGEIKLDRVFVLPFYSQK